MIKESRKGTAHKIFPKECYKSSFYDFYCEGNVYDLRNQKIIATKNVGKYDKVNRIRIYFFIEDISRIVCFTIEEKFKSYYNLRKVEPEPYSNGVSIRYKFDDKVHDLNNYSSLNYTNPKGILAFLTEIETNWIRCHKEVVGAPHIRDMLKEYEKMLNANCYEVDITPDILFMCNYSDYYKISKEVCSDMSNTSELINLPL